MLELSLDGLTSAFRSQWAAESLYVGIVVQLPGSDKPEVIINPKENFKSKLEYYQQAYNDDLTLKNNPQIKIIGYTFGNSFEEIGRELGGHLLDQTGGAE